MINTYYEVYGISKKYQLSNLFYVRTSISANIGNDHNFNFTENETKDYLYKNT